MLLLATLLVGLLLQQLAFLLLPGGLVNIPYDFCLVANGPLGKSRRLVLGRPLPRQHSKHQVRRVSLNFGLSSDDHIAFQKVRTASEPCSLVASPSLSRGSVLSSLNVFVDIHIRIQLLGGICRVGMLSRSVLDLG